MNPSSWNQGAYYSDYETTNTSGDSNNSFHIAGFSIPSQYSHRASAPNNLDLWRLNSLGNNISQIPLERLTKPEQNQPWNSQLRNGSQSQRFAPPSWPSNLSGRPSDAMTEPMPNQDQISSPDMQRNLSNGRSEAADSGYRSQAPPTGGLTVDNYSSDTKELRFEDNISKPPPIRGLVADNYSSDVKELMQDFSPNRLSLDKRFGNHVSNPPPPRSTVSENLNVPRGGRVPRRAPVGICPDCGREAKNQSDAKKHALTHEKPHICHAVGCTRKEGFATENDLQRHRKSVHNLRPTVGNPVGYICQACVQLEGKERKFWPRRDNFKAHIKRKHANHDENKLLEMSKTQRPDDAVTAFDEHSNYISQSRNTSQIDHYEGTGYQQHIGTSPTLSRRVSQQNDYGDSLFQAAVDIPENPLAAMGSHATDMNVQQDQYHTYFGDHSSADGLNSLGQAGAYQPRLNHLHPSSAMPPSKKRKHGDFELSPVTQSQEGHTFATTHSTKSSQSQHQQQQQSEQHSQQQPPQPAAPDLPPILGGDHQCKECGKLTKRECDLKKHMKRHTRPYGCTFANCSRKFGSRNDWKRHENGQHFLSEMWKCGRHRILDGGICMRRPFHNIELMKRHLKGPEHQMHNEQEIEAECRRYCLGREGHEHFWCGFCRELIEQPEEITNAWENRFKHIGDHFDKGFKNIDDWFCIEENKAKKHITDADQTAARRRAKNGCRSDDDGELPEYIPKMSELTVQSSHMGDFDMSSASYSPKHKMAANDDVDAENESDNEEVGMY